MISIISGPSSAGKSTFLKSNNLNALTDIADSSPVLFSSDVTAHCNKITCGDYYLHYNIMRTASICENSKIKSVNLSPYLYSSDKAWDFVSNTPINKTAVVLVTTRSELVQRMSFRNSVEGMLQDTPSNRYQNSYWLSILAQLDLNELYTSWLNELKACGIPFSLIESSTPEYEIIEEKKIYSINLNL